MPSTISLDTETEALLEQLAHIQQRAKADILREALQQFAQDQQPAKVESPYEIVADLIGIAEGGPDDLARCHKQVFAEMLGNKRKP